MRKFLSRIVVSAIIGCASVSAFADTSAIQRIVYVNGIQNTKEDAQDAVNKVSCILGDSPNPMCPDNTSGSVNHTPVKRKFEIHLAYNPYGFDGTALVKQAGLRDDERELFVEKTAEELYIDSLKKLQFPHDKSANADGSGVDWTASGTVAEHYADMTSGYTPTLGDTFDSERSLVGNNSLVLNREVVDADMALTQVTIKSIIDKIELDGTTVVVAHSQGNILTNLAYAAASNGSKLGGGEIKRRVRVVNLANTSQISINNLNLTHAGDGMLFGNLSYAGLKKLATAGANWNRSTPSCPNWGLCDFVLDTPTMLAPEDGEATAIGEHGVLETYLSDKVVEVKDFRGVNYTPDKKRFRDRFEDLVYHAADSLQDAQEGWSILHRDNFEKADDPNRLIRFDANAAPSFSDGLMLVKSGYAGVSTGIDLRVYGVDTKLPIRLRYRRYDHMSSLNTQVSQAIISHGGQVQRFIGGIYYNNQMVYEIPCDRNIITGCVNLLPSPVVPISFVNNRWVDVEMTYYPSQGYGTLKLYQTSGEVLYVRKVTRTFGGAYDFFMLWMDVQNDDAQVGMKLDFIEIKTLKPTRARPLPDPTPIPTPIDPIEPDPPTS